MTDYPQCDSNNPCFDCAEIENEQSDEALARLRELLASADDVFSAPEFPVVLTVFTAYGNVTVENINESSIRLAEGVLTCEEQDGASSCPLFTFGSVMGYSTTFAR